jgi:mRNA-degrading endonuclease HigB of HigAB toxin-antitoxin module
MNERKLIDEIKRLVNNDVIIGYYNGTTFTDDNGKTYASSYLVTNNSPIGRGFIVPYEGKWLVVVANNNQEVRKNIITSRRKISIEDKPKSLTIDYLLVNPLSITLYTIRDNKWKKYEVPEKVKSFFAFNYSYYIDSNYVVIKSGFNYNIDSNYVIKGRYELLTVLKDDVFTIYTYPEEIPVLKTWRKDVFNTYSAGSPINKNNVFTVQQNRLYYPITNLGYIIEPLSLKKSINLNIAKCRFNEDEITSCRKEPFKVKSPKLDTDIISPEEVKKLNIVSTYIKYQ